MRGFESGTLCGRVVHVAGQLSWQLGVVESLSGCCIYGGASDPLPQRKVLYRVDAFLFLR